MIHVVWEFVPRADRIAEFEAAYGPRGDWAVLFSRAEGYGGSTLLRDAPEGRPRYLTIDVWASREARAAFEAAYAAEYAALDARCTELTESERLIGLFDAVDA